MRFCQWQDKRMDPMAPYQKVAKTSMDASGPPVSEDDPLLQSPDSVEMFKVSVAS